jgi:hypothetical protein
MKTIIPYIGEPTYYQDKTDCIFYHDTNVSITREIRPVPEKLSAFSYIDGVETKLTEMSFIVIRFPKSIKEELSHDVYLRLRSVFHFQWGEAGDDVELMIHDGHPASGLFLELDENGLFRYSEKLHPCFKDARYIPYYRYPSTLLQKTVNFFSITTCIPHAIVLMIKDARDDKKRALLAKAREEKELEESVSKV